MIGTALVVLSTWIRQLSTEAEDKWPVKRQARINSSHAKNKTMDDRVSKLLSRHRNE